MIPWETILWIGPIIGRPTKVLLTKFSGAMVANRNFGSWQLCVPHTRKKKLFNYFCLSTIFGRCEKAINGSLDCFESYLNFFIMSVQNTSLTTSVSKETFRAPLC